MLSLHVWGPAMGLADLVSPPPQFLHCSTCSQLLSSALPLELELFGGDLRAGHTTGHNSPAAFCACGYSLCRLSGPASFYSRLRWARDSFKCRVCTVGLWRSRVGWGWVIDGSASAFVYPAGLVWISPVLLLLMHSTLKENRAFVL